MDRGFPSLPTWIDSTCQYVQERLHLISKIFQSIILPLSCSGKSDPSVSDQQGIRIKCHFVFRHYLIRDFGFEKFPLTDLEYSSMNVDTYFASSFFISSADP
ncbi:unnamed protein product [Albugo candida]|uniref:Uncharacterized protein n=1 Tax=Albugo candida TaxID=65357 RepID=A0A024G684_9STRA|nr:unnamed protein product [Albugo candida]|eukprot:CCI42063.1 unnamed protein product [Albugo candida]